MPTKYMTNFILIHIHQTQRGELVKNGWVVIHRLTYIDFGYIFDINRHLTNEQKAVIKPVFENNREDILKYNREILELEFEEC